MSAKKKRSQTIDFLVLGFILGMGLLAYIFFSHQAQYQLFSVSVTAITYVSWGVWHHKGLRNISFSIIAEYILVGILAIALVLSNVYLS